MSARLSQEEIARRIAAGEAIRQARAEKRKNFEAGKEKEKILNQSLVSTDVFHKGLNQRIAQASHYLQDVLYRGKTLELRKIPEISDLFCFASDMDARVAYKMCTDNYGRLMGACWHFQRGKTAILGQTAFEFWHKMLAYAEVSADGALILNILTSGNIGAHLLSIMKDYRAKVEDVGMSNVIVNICKRLLNGGGMRHIITGEVKIWNDAQSAILKELIELYDTTDYRILEEMAEDSAE